MGIDPVGVDENNVHSHNRYAYANNNPYKFVDPDGRAAIFALLLPYIAPTLQVAGVGITSYETTSVVVNVASGQQTVGQAVREEAPGIAIGVVTGGTGRVATKLLKILTIFVALVILLKVKALNSLTRCLRPRVLKLEAIILSKA